MKLPLFFALVLGWTTIYAQRTVVNLYDGPAPGSEAWKQVEKESTVNSWNTRIIFNVVKPTLTVFRPAAGKANGTAVVICPGGGFHALSMDSEGFDVAKALTAKGITCFVLKYRLIEAKTDNPIAEYDAKSAQQLATEIKPVAKLALQDAQTAIAYVRKNAKLYEVNANRIGIIGFSAGGSVAASAAYNYNADSRPDFVAPIYLQYDWAVKGAVPADAPPMFLLAATDDQLGLAPHSVRLYTDWTTAKKSAELHILRVGGHGFGMRKQNLPSDNWVETYAIWLDNLGLMKK